MNTLTAEQPRADRESDGHHHDGRGHDHKSHLCSTTKIVVDNDEVPIHPGRYDVATIKKLSKVPLTDDLDQLIDCKLKPIPDNATVDIHGCEIFVSHPKDGGSS